MRVLITGASGVMGPHLVRRLLAEGHSCRCLMRRSEIPAHLRDPNVEIVTGDVTQPETLAGIGEGMDWLFHLATLGHASHFKVPDEMFEAVNVQGTLNIMTEALRSGVSKVVHCSSTAAMGICSDNPATESSPCNPHHPYGRSKLRAEREVLRLVDESGLPACIVRFSMVYGPGDRHDVLKLVKLAKRGLWPKVGKRPKLTPLVHINDALQGLLLAMEKGLPGQTYLITNPRPEPFDRLRQTILSALDVRRPTLYVPESIALGIGALCEWLFPLIGRAPPVTRKNIESTLADRVFSNEKAERELGFMPRVDPEQGLRETVQWYKEHGWI